MSLGAGSGAQVVGGSGRRGGSRRVVGVLEMAQQGALVFELSLTRAAHIHATVVHHHVTTQTRCVEEDFGTPVAAVQRERSRGGRRVLPRVCREGAALREALVAHRAREGTLLSMHQQMPDHDLLLREGPPADVAGVGPLARVRAQVPRQRAAAGQAPPALRAPRTLFVWFIFLDLSI